MCEKISTHHNADLKIESQNTASKTDPIAEVVTCSDEPVSKGDNDNNCGVLEAYNNCYNDGQEELDNLTRLAHIHNKQISLDFKECSVLRKLICFLCHDSRRDTSIELIDTSGPYTLSNCISVCRDCLHDVLYPFYGYEERTETSLSKFINDQFPTVNLNKDIR